MQVAPPEDQRPSKNKGGGAIKRRITQACILCRKKKIKCDGAKPECVHCLDANLQCQYTEYKKRGPHKGYVRLLEERLVQLEKRLTGQGAEIPPPISSTSPLSPTYSPPPQLSSSSLSPLKTSERLINAFKQEQQPAATVEDDDFPPPEISTHLIELFFQYINSVFPFVHRGRLKQSIQDGNVSKPLLWGVMAIAARFSDHPQIKTDPPYWAGERFAHKATSLINASLLEPTIPNLQFWGIMSCLEYGRASGSKAWTYGGIAVRICQELGLDKEEVLKSPILSADGSIDYVAMALRRRIFWSCVCIDKFASTSTNRPQGFEMGDYDAQPPTLAESGVLWDPSSGFTLDNRPVPTDPLMGVIPRYLRVLERFGEICKHMSRAKTDNSTVTWPPVPEANELNALLKSWREGLPDQYQFTPANLHMFKESATQNYLNFWLCSHAMYCTGMLALHRGSLAYSDLTIAELPRDTYDRIQNSIQECKVNVEMATDVFKALRDICGCNVLPYMGYCAYIFSTVLMTSAFSSDPVSYTKSSEGLAILFETIELLRPYWPMSERLANTTRDMLATHSRLYEVQERAFERKRSSNTTLQSSSDIDSLASMSSTTENNSLPSSTPYASYSSNNNGNNNIMPVTATMSTTAPLQQSPQSISQQQPIQQQPLSSTNNTNAYQQQQQSQLTQIMNNENIDFNSCEFLYDSALFGQIIFDTTNQKDPNELYNINSQQSMQQDYPSIMLNTNNAPLNTVPQMFQQQAFQQQDIKTGGPWGQA